MTTTTEIYVGAPGGAGVRVSAVGPGGVRPLPDRSGRCTPARLWSTRGEQGRELAWSLIFDATGDRRLATDWCTDLAAEILDRLPRDAFQIEADDLLAWLQAGPPAIAMNRGLTGGG